MLRRIALTALAALCLPALATAQSAAKLDAQLAQGSADSDRRVALNRGALAAEAWNVLQAAYEADCWEWDPFFAAAVYLALADARDEIDAGMQCVYEGGDNLYQSALAYYREGEGQDRIGNYGQADVNYRAAEHDWINARLWYDAAWDHFLAALSILGSIMPPGGGDGGPDLGG